jgi:tetrapyrrole methylase family protein/MazG family protein
MTDATRTEFERLLQIVSILRGPSGCSWDRAQTPASLTPYLLEEAYEVIESIQEENPQRLKEELGDLLLHIVFQCDIATEKQQFDMAEVLRAINEKLIRRHPHVFGDIQTSDIQTIKQNWESIKLREGRNSLMEGLPRSLPALLQARRVQERAAQVGFDWEDISGVRAKLDEELAELDAAIKTNDASAIKDEMGDLLFTIVNLARFLNLDPEEALRQSVNKFVARFKELEAELAAQGKNWRESSLYELDEIWNRLKKR